MPDRQDARAEQETLIAALRRPGALPGDPGSATLHETHVSWVLVGRDRAYKVKKALTLAFLDYGTLAQRRACCEAEVALNRRLAPDLYLGVRGIARTPGGAVLVDPDGAGVVEHAVEMRRFDERSTLAARILAGEPCDEPIDAAGRMIAAFHACAARVPGVDSPGGLLSRLADTRSTLDELIGDPLRLRLMSGAARGAAAAIGRHAPLLRRRAASGLVRDGHGDLRAEHVLWDPDVGMQVVDCVEFDPLMRRVDVGADLAFLLMDLEGLGRPDLAARLLDSYVAAGGEPGPPALLWALATDRALVRVKVALLRAAQQQGAEARRSRERAEDLLDLAERLAWRARLPLAIAVCGPPASGKSTLAAAIAEASGLAVLASDLVRKELGGIAPTERGRQGLYGADVTRRVYAQIAERAAREVDSRGGAILDATFGRREARDLLRASLAGTPLLWAACEVPRALALARAAARERDPERISDADVAVAARLAASFEPLAECRPAQRAVIDATRPVGEQLEQVREAADGLLAGTPVHEGEVAATP